MTPLQRLQRVARICNLAVDHFEHKDFIRAVRIYSTVLGDVKRIIMEMESVSPSAAVASSSSEDVAVCLLHHRLCHRSVMTIGEGTMIEDPGEEKRPAQPVSSSTRSNDPSSSGEVFSGSRAHPPASFWMDNSRFTGHRHHCGGDDLPATWNPSHPFAAEGRPFIYDRPFRISEEAIHFRSMDHHLLSEISVAILFNLALCHHMRVVDYRSCILGTEPNRLHEVHEDTATIRLVFQQALLLYGFAYEVQLRNHFELSPECTMAIANNMGHIHQEMGDKAKASACFSSLLSNLFYISSNASTNREDYGHEGDVHSCKESQLFTEGFVHSVSHMILKKQAAEAA